MATILFVVAIVLIINHSGRISRLEKALALLNKKPVDAGQNQQQPVSQTVVPNTVTNPSSQPIYGNIAQAPLQASANVAEASNSTQEIKHSEESSGRMLGKLGIGAVLVGVAFFLKYAFDNNWIGPSGRVMVGVLLGIAFLVVGQILRKKYLRYSDLIMGGGSAILYLSFFSAYSFYGLISAPTAGVLMLCVTALTLAISIVDATITLSVVGIVGAFVTPFLVGYHENNIFWIFSYLTLINLGVLGISFFKKWPHLNALTFVGNAINFLVWYGNFYNQTELGPTLMFCVISFLIFLIANIARGITAGVKANEADYFLLGANAFAFAVMGYILLNPVYHGVLGFCSVLVALIYMIVAYLVNKTNYSDKALNIFLPGLAVVFLSIAVPLQFSGPWIAVAWFVESVALYVIASVISNRGFQVMGVIVYCLGLLDLFTWTVSDYTKEAFVPIFNKNFIVFVLAVIVAYIIAYMYKKFGSINIDIQKRGITVFIVIANILTVYALSTQIMLHYYSVQVSLSNTHRVQISDADKYNTGYGSSQTVQDIDANYYKTYESISNKSNTSVSILWTIYAAILIAVGFAKRISGLRRLGLILFFITAVKVVMNVWSLGQLYRIISFIVFGLIALIASFAYAKYKDRLKDVI
jgi:uncharacterized membrane protein